MSRLNAGAYEFVPGRGFRPPPQQHQGGPTPPPGLQPFQREELPDAPPPAPAPTISLKIGGTKPAPATASASKPAPQPAPPKPVAEEPKLAPVAEAEAKPTPAPPKKEAKKAEREKEKEAAGSKTFTMDRAKTDTAAVAQEVQTVAEQNVLDELYGNLKEHLNIVFIGHVDAGKSTMGGNILYISGMVDKRTMEKYEREAKEAGRDSWYLSWALDSTPQERAKGKTVEVGRAYFETPARRYTILDAPGHKTFVPSMIAGAAQADVAVLVISARKGEFETGFERGGQTREHIMLVKTAGVSKLVVVINKMDEATVGWSKARFDEIKDKLMPFIRGAGFNLKADVSFVPASAYTGANLKERLTKDVCPWWDGPSLLEHLDKMPMVDRKIGAPLMMPVSEKYSNLGTIAVGKVESGLVRKGDTLLLMPNRVPVEVTSVTNEIEEDVPAGVCGDNVRIRLRGVEDEDISPGFVLTSPAKPVHAVRAFEAQLAILEHKNIICAGYSAVMHVHTLAEEVTLSALLHYFDKATGKKSRKPPQFAKKGQRIVALIETTAPICVERFADYPQLGRFTLRDEGKTIAIGKVRPPFAAFSGFMSTLRPLCPPFNLYVWPLHSYCSHSFLSYRLHSLLLIHASLYWIGVLTTRGRSRSSSKVPQTISRTASRGCHLRTECGRTGVLEEMLQTARCMFDRA
ncbi:P-loop containing nucleoside triphosphate hydrolase protein [Vararia minispora EC-137]|uniref:P-loop containing nucleoside triphosphate hydrolase protein n=1 Tax=Vararia minispora EC-137 TaxID=1314806 RepID=A0ACB8QFU8_9AGAM|nr:P-loop containing nucleoside triphosphate hydrolase protein [Vararia minispora EC-137]